MKKQSNLPAYILMAVTAVVILAMVLGEHFTKVDKPVYKVTEPTSFILKVEQNQNVVKAEFKKETGFLYITVVNDGEDKAPMAELYKRMAVENSAYQVKAIKIVDAKGKELGKAFL